MLLAGSMPLMARAARTSSMTRSESSWRPERFTEPFDVAAHEIAEHTKRLDITGPEVGSHLEAEAAQRAEDLSVRQPDRHAQMGADPQRRGRGQPRGHRMPRRVGQELRQRTVDDVVAVALLERAAPAFVDHRTIGIDDPEDPLARHRIATGRPRRDPNATGPPATPGGSSDPAPPPERRAHQTRRATRRLPPYTHRRPLAQLVERFLRNGRASAKSDPRAEGFGSR